MNTAIRALQPTNVWNHFADLNAVPRASKKEENVIAFMVDFGKKLFHNVLGSKFLISEIICLNIYYSFINWFAYFFKRTHKIIFSSDTNRK